MYILQFDICALIIIIIMLVSNYVRGIVVGKANKTCILLMVMALLATIGDFGMSYLCDVATPSSRMRTIIYCFAYLYFFAHNNLTVVYIMYIITVLKIGNIIKHKKMFVYIILVPTILQNLLLASNFVFGKFFTIDENLDYARGPLMPEGYVFAMIIMLGGVWVLIKYRRLISKDRFVVLFANFPLVCLALIMQALFPKLLIEMFMTSLSIVLFVVVVQRQEEFIDPVVGAKKYNASVDSLRKIIATQTPVSIILYKVVNNRNIAMYLGLEGHNDFLAGTCTKLKNTARSMRYDADIYYLEYGLFALMSESASPEIVAATAERILAGAAENDEELTKGIIPDIRVCVVKCPEDIDEFYTLLRFGVSFHDGLMDEHRVFYYRDFANNPDFVLRSELDDIIKDALRNNKFEVHYQPIYSLEENRFVAAEAFLRLNDEKHGNISPNLFIAAAEASGDMHAIGSFVFEEVFRFISQNDIEKIGIKQVHINLSPSQCIEVDFIDRIQRLLDKYHVSPEDIVLELTESTADFDPVIVDANVYKLSKIGISFAIDGYGTGYSNVKRVTDLPIDLIKLDRSFVSNIDEDKMQIIVPDTINMLKEMGKKVLVGGIESEELAAYFKKVGCDYLQGCEYLQGFYFCKALPGKEFVPFVKSKNKL